MKTIRNESGQKMEIYLMTPGGAKVVRLSPREQLTVPSNYIGKQIETLAHRRILAVRNA